MCRTSFGSWQAFFVDFKTTEEAFDFACLFVGIITQHAIGGALCCASVFNLASVSLATTLAGHGAMCEVGWELQDVVVRAYQLVFGGSGGKAKNPTPLLVILAIHHSMGLGMAIPMNLSFASEPYYHESKNAPITPALAPHAVSGFVERGGPLARLKAHAPLVRSSPPCPPMPSHALTSPHIPSHPLTCALTCPHMSSHGMPSHVLADILTRPLLAALMRACGTCAVVFLLQFAAAFALMTQNYGYTLDTKTASGLLRMKMAVTLTLIVMIYSRVLRFAYCGYQLLCIAYASGNTHLFFGGSIVVVLMSLLNILFVSDAAGKFSKFMKLKHIDTNDGR